MEMKIFNHILFDSLMPWLIKSSDKSQMRDDLKEAVKYSPENLQDLTTQMKYLLAHKPVLTKWLDSQSVVSPTVIKELAYSTELPDFSDTTSKFYSLLIDNECLRVYNACLSLPAQYKEDEDLWHYHTANALRNLKHYILTASKEIKSRKLTYSPETTAELIPFVLFYLKYKLIALYFSIQLANREVLETVVELDDFYLMELEETKADIHPLFLEQPEVPVAKQKNTKRLSFGFDGKPEKLKAIINALCAQVELLNETISPAQVLVELLLSKDIKPGKVKIQLACDNKHFRLVIERLQPSFTALSFINIEHSESFYSKGGTLLKSNTLSKSPSHNAKERVTIDKIFNQLQ